VRLGLVPPPELVAREMAEAVQADRRVTPKRWASTWYADRFGCDDDAEPESVLEEEGVDVEAVRRVVRVEGVNRYRRYWVGLVSTRRFGMPLRLWFSKWGRPDPCVSILAKPLLVVIVSRLSSAAERGANGRDQDGATWVEAYRVSKTGGFRWGFRRGFRRVFCWGFESIHILFTLLFTSYSHGDSQ